ncbi:hypothetical protein PFISCL1PPCAC_9332, partial [Pristionchus fissidentatus]
PTSERPMWLRQLKMWERSLGSSGHGHEGGIRENSQSNAGSARALRSYAGECCTGEGVERSSRVIGSYGAAAHYC